MSQDGLYAVGRWLREDRAASATLTLAVALGLFSVVFATALVMTRDETSGIDSEYSVDAQNTLRALRRDVAEETRVGYSSLAKLGVYRDLYGSVPSDASGRHDSGWSGALQSLGVDPTRRAEVTYQPQFAVEPSGRVPALDGYRVAFYAGRITDPEPSAEVAALARMGAEFQPVVAGEGTVGGDIFRTEDLAMLGSRLAGFEGPMGVSPYRWRIVEAETEPGIPCIPITGVLTCSSAPWEALGCSNPMMGPPDPFGRARPIANFNDTVPERLLTTSTTATSTTGGCQARKYVYEGGEDRLLVTPVSLSGTGALVESPTAPKVNVTLSIFMRVPSGRELKDYLEIQTCAPNVDAGVTCGFSDPAWSSAQGLRVMRTEWTESIGACVANPSGMCTITRNVPPSILAENLLMRFVWRAATGAGEPTGARDGGVFITHFSIALDQHGAATRTDDSCEPERNRRYLYCNRLDYGTSRYDVLVTGSGASESSLLSALQPALLKWSEKGGALVTFGTTRGGYAPFWRVFGVENWENGYACAAAHHAPHIGRVHFARPAVDEPLLSTPNLLYGIYSLSSGRISSFFPKGWTGACAAEPAPAVLVARLEPVARLDLRMVYTAPSSSSSSSSSGGSGSGGGCLMAHSGSEPRSLDRHSVSALCKQWKIQAATSDPVLTFPLLSVMERPPHSEFRGCFIATALKPGAFDQGSGMTAAILGNLLLRCRYAEAYGAFGDERPADAQVVGGAEAWAVARTQAGTDVRLRLAIQIW